MLLTGSAPFLLCPCSQTARSVYSLVPVRCGTKTTVYFRRDEPATSGSSILYRRGLLFLQVPFPCPEALPELCDPLPAKFAAPAATSTEKPSVAPSAWHSRLTFACSPTWMSPVSSSDVVSQAESSLCAIRCVTNAFMAERPQTALISRICLRRCEETFGIAAFRRL